MHVREITREEKKGISIEEKGSSLSNAISTLAGLFKVNGKAVAAFLI